MKSYLYTICSLGLLILIHACSKPKETIPVAKTDLFAVREFVALTNYVLDSTGKEHQDPRICRLIRLDYRDALASGFVIPSQRQVEGGFFKFRFSLRNTSGKSQSFRYYLIYENETYAFPWKDHSDSSKMYPLAAENFYGNWDDPATGFHTTAEIPADEAFHAITDSFRIIGNPRNEPRYFNGENNDRWKRNPRVGKYAFSLIITVSENLQQGIPAYIQDISQSSPAGFVHPLWFFLHGEGKSLNNTLVLKAPERLKVVAVPDLSAGIFINPFHFRKEEYGAFFSSSCGQDENISQQAQIEQFIHYIDPSTRFNNIPVIADVLKGQYSKLDYNWNRSFYTQEECIGAIPATSKRPCETVYYDAEGKKIILKNPGCKFGEWRKENVGIITRHGLTYGKYTVRCKLTELLNKNNMWNGLTNAIWLITQDQSSWNLRRSCNKEGYLANYYGGKQDDRVPQVAYSEIDFEILKTVPYCPPWVLPPAYNIPIADPVHVNYWNIPFPEEVAAMDPMITVACTNWDMACWEPEKFEAGCGTVEKDGQKFYAHRWDNWYRALTEKTPELDDELFGSEYYYFQIDWRPEEIIWRIGPEKDKLRVVGYMNKDITSIPNNQMLLIITQEFHNTKWWIGSPYAQDNIPFPENDIIGELHEITIE
ncbi:MAG: hypothetical protein FJY10_06415 [Bacteroidetes bacterium]|nr:hypothetical protein [Bacteroidota bacterium]